MLKRVSLFCKKKTRGQATVEMALVLPIFLLLVVGIMEVGRIIFIYNAVYTASREGARYGASTGVNGSGTPRYNDCAGIRGRAKSVGILAQLTDGNISIKYDSGPDSNGNTTIKYATCPAPADPNPIDQAHPPSLILGDRVIVTVTKTYTTLVPITNFTFPITSTTARTLIKDLDVNKAP
jgi:Flp pilus assembly protein TadG